MEEPRGGLKAGRVLKREKMKSGWKWSGAIVGSQWVYFWREKERYGEEKAPTAAGGGGGLAEKRRLDEKAEESGENEEPDEGIGELRRERERREDAEAQQHDHEQIRKQIAAQKKQNVHVQPDQRLELTQRVSQNETPTWRTACSETTPERPIGFAHNRRFSAGENACRLRPAGFPEIRSA